MCQQLQETSTPLPFFLHIHIQSLENHLQTHLPCATVLHLEQSFVNHTDSILSAKNNLLVEAKNIYNKGSILVPQGDLQMISHFKMNNLSGKICSSFLSLQFAQGENLQGQIIAEERGHIQATDYFKNVQSKIESDSYITMQCHHFINLP